MTTALERYAKLEAEAVYAPGPGEPERSVILGFGARTLTILGTDDRAIGHWPLASLRAVSDDRPGMTLAPDRISAERLHLDDALMIDAIRAVVDDLEGGQEAPPTPRRSGRWLFRLTIVGALVVGVLWLASQDLVDWTSVENEEALGARMAEALPSVLAQQGGTLTERCLAPEGRAALGRLMRRVLPESGRAATLRLAVLRHPEPFLLVLPDGRSFLSDSLLQAARSPEHVAALITHAAGHHAGRDALEHVLSVSGILGRARIVVTGDPGAEEAERLTRLLVSARFGEGAERAAGAMAEELLEEAGLPKTALADFAAGASDMLPAFRMRHGGAGAAAADDNPRASFDPALNDRSWIALQNICDRSVIR